MSKITYLPTVQSSNSPYHQVHRYESNTDYGVQEDGTLSLFYIVDLVRKHLLLGSVLIPLCAISALLLSTKIRPIYKSPAVLHIQSTYFKEPLVNDVISEEHDQSELRARRDSLIQLALSDEFLLSLVDEYPAIKIEIGIEDFQKPYSDREKAWIVYELRGRMEYFGESSSTFRVGAMASTPGLAVDMNRRFIGRIVESMSAERSMILKQTKDAITAHVKKLAAELNAIEKSLKVSDEHELSEQHQALKADLSALLIQYTAKHPKVSKLQQEVSSLEKRLAAYKKSNQPKVARGAMFGEIPRSESAKQPTQDVYNELLKKLSYLQIALSLDGTDASNHLRVIQQPTYPVQPIFPRKDMFALMGALAGFLFWIIGIIVREAKALHPEGADIEILAETTQLPFLGRLPYFDSENIGNSPSGDMSGYAEPTAENPPYMNDREQSVGSYQNHENMSRSEGWSEPNRGFRRDGTIILPNAHSSQDTAPDSSHGFKNVISGGGK